MAGWGISWNSTNDYGLFTESKDVLSNDFFDTLLDMSVGGNQMALVIPMKLSIEFLEIKKDLPQELI